MNEEFEKFIAWHYPDIGEGAKIEFERCWDAGAAAGYANGVAVMKERCAEVAEADDTCECSCSSDYECNHCTIKKNIAAAIRRMK